MFHFRGSRPVSISFYQGQDHTLRMESCSRRAVEERGALEEHRCETVENILSADLPKA